VTSSLLHTRGATTAYQVTGSGKPVVLGHSLLCSGEMWRGQVDALAAGYCVINIDYRGHGAAGPTRSPFTVYDLVEDTVAVLDELGIERAAWAGLSLGGMVAMRAALTKPRRVAALVLANTDAGAERIWNRTKYAALRWIARTIGMRPVLGQAVRQMFGATARRSQPSLVSEWHDRFAVLDVPSVALALQAVTDRDDLSARLASVRVPTLVITGGEDASLPPSLSRALAGAIPGARLLELESTGHLSALEQPERVTAAMLRFLDQLYDPAWVAV